MYYLYWLFFRMVPIDGRPSLRALKAVSTISGWESLRPVRMPAKMVSCWTSSKTKLNYFSCSQMKPTVRMETSLTVGSWFSML